MGDAIAGAGREWGRVAGRRFREVGTQRPGYLAIVILGTPTRGTSLTVIWNNKYNI